MRPLGSITIDVRLQAVVIYLFAVVWLGLLFHADRQPQNLPLLVQTFFVSLPLLNALLALFILEARFRHKERCTWWVYLAVAVGLLPPIGLALEKWTA
jgi:hypothetical protein